MIEQKAIEQLRRLMEAREARDVANKAKDDAEKTYREIEADVYEALEENPVKGTLKVDLGAPWGVVSFGPRETYFARIVDEDKALEHYRSRAQIHEVSAPKFVMKRINEDVRQAKEDGTPPPPGTDWFARRGVTITRQKT